ncbi:Acyl transferase/acyl hydrolase/lysophospholipase [Penicillium expansum]|uniref:Acyl transferase/acyl hydrolase/lysophospholipase n=1 Tax=Penicillium expansum TaxID=27334 RepID=A0A0A2JUZ5_PENEN|nr:Acyl transferase/acyl hydrolase/lysophospholipase [Penicillium expansum]KGO37540.1 Acyl transferase/acyl hydrolase/lysophospholipase [Penicillium expansum]KGO40395.1 Acyl transferase/acyl hydrolase/lysophospholipase [Penicillium expansum]KGO59262.1 Acyl transferase/acyl hydrolase/lysophospholipase [Penicillium expansum]
MPFVTDADYRQPDALIRSILQQDKSMPIAIVGMSCRFPGDATNPDKLWKLVAEKQAAWSEIPKDRMNVDAFYHPDAERAGNMNARGGHFLKQDLGAFDASFFSISPTEAKSMDPQQRLLLETVYEAMESGGMTLEDVANTMTSCYVGCFSHDYYDMGDRDAEIAPIHSSTGNSSSILSNRISYFYNLKGPSLTMDTACSSGLIAMHLACQSLRAGESKQAVVGATNLMFMPDVFSTMSNLHFLSPDSICYSYDDRANGYARGEAVTALILKPLEDAIRDNDSIRAVVRSSACNQDGRTFGITQPSPDAQQELIRTAYRDAGLEFDQTDYFEAHGTGTQAGDPIESSAIGATFGQSRPLDKNGKKIPLYVGSVKTNIGHTEGASGLAGLIKAVIALERGVIPPNIRFESPNPKIDLKGWNLEVPTEVMPWPREGQRRASVNSFGFGGSNSHVIIDDAYHYLLSRGLRAGHRTSPKTILDVNCTVASGNESHGAFTLRGNGFMSKQSRFNNSLSDSLASHVVEANDRYRIFMWSTHEESIGALNNTAYAEHLAQRQIADEEAFLDNLAYTQCARRSLLEWRSFLVAKSVSDLKDKILNTHQKPVRAPTKAQRLGFVFTGQGAQWYAMGRELSRYSVFHSRILESDLFITKLGAEWSVIEELEKSEKDSRINESLFSQTLCTVVQMALVDLLASWGIRPHKVIGHSSGEIAAAYAAGILPAESAIKAAYFRGVYSGAKILLSANGGMMAVGLSEEEANKRISALDPAIGKAVVACINSPTSVTISGDHLALDSLSQSLQDDGVFARFLKVSTAYHSHHMDLVADDYAKAIADMEVKPVSDVEMFSTVTGALVTATDVLGPEYWRKNMVSCVRFNDGLQSLCTSQPSGKRSRRRAGVTMDIIMEIGPHAALAGPVKQILRVPALEKAEISYQSILSRGQDACETALQAAAFLFARGLPVKLSKINDPDNIAKPQVIVDLPAYFWNHRKRHWHESRLALEHRFRRHARTDLLGYPVSDWNPMEPRWRNLLRLREQPWIKGHSVQGSYIYPGMGYICMAIEAMHHMKDFPEYITPAGELVGYRLKDIKISRALVIPSNDEMVETLFSMRHYKESSSTFSDVWYEFRIFSYNSGTWLEHAHGLISAVHEVNAAAPTNNLPYLPDLERVMASTNLSGSRSAENMYKMMAEVGLNFEHPFRNMIGELRSNPGEAQGVITVPNTKELMPHNFEYPHIIHPATMDAFVQMIFPAFLHEKNACPAAFVPVSFEEVFISTDVARGPGSTFKCATTAVPSGPRELKTEVLVTDEATGKLVAGYKGMGCSRLDAASAENQDENASLRKLCFHSTWQPDPTLMPRGLTDSMMCQLLPPVEDSSRVSELETIAYYFYHKALQNIREEQVYTMKPHFQMFYEYLQYQRDLVMAQQLPHQTAEWQQLNDPLIAAKMEALIERLQPTDVDSEILCRVGRQLDKILLSEADPLAIMLEDDRLYQYYGRMIPTTTLHEYATLLSNKNPNMEVLEIGAGTGGATESILEAMGGNNGRYPRFQSYTFTDISSGFFEQAQLKFKDWEGLMDFRRLNIEEDPVEQGFEKQYDLVVAALVLHATANIDKTIEHTRKLLKPGGRLIMVEISNPLNQVFLPFGCTPGWWMSEESYRKWGPTMSEDMWGEVLKRHGFGDFTLGAPNNLNSKDEIGRVWSCVAVDPVIEETQDQEVNSVIIITDDVISDSSEVLRKRIERRVNEMGLAVQTVPLSRIAETPLENTFSISIAELDRAIICDLNQSEFDSLQHLRTGNALLWISEGASGTSKNPDRALFHGLARTLRTENETHKLVTADFATIDHQEPEDAANHVISLFEFLFRNPESQECEFWFEHGCWQINRVIGVPEVNRVIHDSVSGDAAQHQKIEEQPFYQTGRPLKLNIKTPGLLDTLVFEDDTRLAEPLASHDAEVEVKASGVNFRDIMISTGQMSDTALGFECSGIVTRIGSDVDNVKIGDRVTVWSRNTYCNYLRNDARVMQRIPDDMSFEVAAAIPIVFATVVYGFSDMARLSKGESVLIHAASGGVGQAAIMYAQMVGADVFVTVGTQAKRDLVRHEFGIPEDRIFNSRDLSFARQIKEATGGRGVDVVLNSLAGEALSATWSCIAMFGRFIEIGKKDIIENRLLDMAPFVRNVSFHALDLNTVRWCNVPLASRLLAEAMDLIRSKKLRPIQSVKTFTFSQIEEAFRFMQAGKHVGKVVAVPGENDIVPAYPVAPRPLTLSPDASYLIAGFGGLGQSLARWLAEHGARNLIFASRSGARRPAMKQLIEELEELHVRVEPLSVDVTDGQALKSELERVATFMPPIRGMIQAAMVLDDQIFENMSLDSFNRAVRPKVDGTWNLHKATIGQPLDFFVILSSAVGVLGNPGQANYGAGNTYQDALASYLRTIGRPATAIDLGLMIDVGAVAEEESGVKLRNLKRKGYVGVTEAELLASMGLVIQGAQKEHTSVIIAGIDASEGGSEVSWMSSPIFSHLSKLDMLSSSGSKDQTTRSTLSLLKEVDSFTDASVIVLEAIRAKLSRNLMIDMAELDPHRPTSAFGIDSLIAVELRNWFQKDMKVDFPVFEILQASSLQSLAFKVAERSGFDGSKE